MIPSLSISVQYLIKVFKCFSYFVIWSSRTLRFLKVFSNQLYVVTSVIYSIENKTQLNKYVISNAHKFLAFAFIWINDLHVYVFCLLEIHNIIHMCNKSKQIIKKFILIINTFVNIYFVFNRFKNLLLLKWNLSYIQKKETQNKINKSYIYFIKFTYSLKLSE